MLTSTPLKSVIVLAIFFIMFSAPKAEADRREGRISWKRCPHSCASERIEKKNCRDWRQNDICMVEDLTKPRQRDVREDTDGRLGDNEYPGPNTFKNRDALSSAPTPWSTPTPILSGQPGFPANCSGENLRYIRQPRVEVNDIRSRGNLFGDKYRVRGTIEGTCISEAGYYEEGRLKEKIAITTAPEFKRYEFEVSIRGDSSRDPEIRAYAANGDRDQIELSRLVEREFGNGYQGGW